MERVSLAGKGVLVTLPLTERQREEFSSLVSSVGGSVSFVSDADVTEADVAAAAIIIGTMPVDMLHASPELEWVQTSTAGYDHLLAPGVLAPGTRLSNASGAYGQAVSEHMLAQLLCLMKRLHRYRDNQGRGLWRDEGPVTSLVGARVLVLGAGDVGTSFARLVRDLGAHVTGMRRSVVEATEPYERMITPDALRDTLPQTDVVASVLPSTPQTRGMANDAFFARMKRGAFFVNAGRGDFVDQDALCRALSSGNLAGAALDVTDPEPLPADHPLWRQPNALITPHVAGWWHLQATVDNVVRISLANLRCYLAGKPLKNEVVR